MSRPQTDKHHTYEDDPRQPGRCRYCFGRRLSPAHGVADPDAARKAAPQGESTHQRYALVRLTLTRDYAIPMHDDESDLTKYGPFDERSREWFEQYPLDVHHATRDKMKIGLSERLVSIERLPDEVVPRG